MESNHLPVAYQATARPESLAAMEPMLRIELRSVAYHATALSLSYIGAAYAPKQWIPAADLNRALDVTNVVRRHLRLQGIVTGAEYGSPTRLTGLEDQHLSDRPTPLVTLIQLSKIQTAELGREGWIRTSVPLLPRQMR